MFVQGRKIVHGAPTSHHSGSGLAASTIAAAGGGGGGIHHSGGIKLDRKHSLPSAGGHSMIGRDVTAAAASYLAQDSFSFDQLQPHIQAGSNVSGNIPSTSGIGASSGGIIGTGNVHQQGQGPGSSGIGNVSGAGSYPLQHIGAGGSAIAAAASQAIAATQQLTGRRTVNILSHQVLEYFGFVDAFLRDMLSNEHFIISSRLA